MAKPQPKAQPLSVTKTGNNEITVRFGADLPSLAKLKPGAEVPAEYLHSILNFHIDKQDATGKVDDKQIERMKAYW